MELQSTRKDKNDEEADSITFLQRTFFRTQEDVAGALNEVVDAYWNMDIKDDELLGYLELVLQRNDNKIFGEHGEFTSTLQQRCGKRRLELIRKCFNTIRKGGVTNGCD
jgi:uncharacterized protein (TIGR04540 family)